MNTMQTQKSPQSGFTLIEIAMVLLIIGLLLGGVLKGQELIGSARVKSLANDFHNVPVFIYGYQDKYRRLPGDDDAADDQRFTGYRKASASGQTPGNGIVQGAWDATDLGSESVLFWQHVRGAGFVAGSTDFSSLAKAALPTNAIGGRLGIQMTPPIKGLAGAYYLCSQNVPGKLVEQLDLLLDDGQGNSGNLRGQAGSGTDATKDGETYSTATPAYTVCMAF